MQEQTKSEGYSWIKSIVFAILIALLCRHFLFSPTTVFGKSMSPTFGDTVEIKDDVLYIKGKAMDKP